MYTFLKQKKTVGTLFLFTDIVKHSQSLSVTPLKVWVTTYSSGEVVCAHCTCMAGIGEACTHIAALLFTTEANTQVKSQFSCIHCHVHGYHLHSRKFHILKYHKQILLHQSININSPWIYHQQHEIVLISMYLGKEFLLFLSLLMNTKGNFTSTCPNLKDLQ